MIIGWHLHAAWSLAALTAALLAAGCSRVTTANASPSEAEPVVSVGLARVEHGPFTRHVRVPGVVHMKREVNLAFLVGGIVTRVSVQEGDRVRAGQVLATLDATALDAVRRQAIASAQKGERDLARVRLLQKTGALPKADLEDAETGVAIARAAAQAAQFNAAHATLVAPESGVIDRRVVEPGQVVAPGAPVLHLNGASQGVVVRVALSSREAMRVHVGDAAKVALDVAPDAPLEAKVSQIAAAASPGTGAYEIELSLAHAPPNVLSGLTAKVEIDQAEPVSAVIPIGALVDADGLRAAAFVVRATRAKRVPVAIRFIEGDVAVLSSGLDSDEFVVKAGVSDLSDGALVRVQP